MCELSNVKAKEIHTGRASPETVWEPPNSRRERAALRGEHKTERRHLTGRQVLRSFESNGAGTSAEGRTNEERSLRKERGGGEL